MAQCLCSPPSACPVRGIRGFQLTLMRAAMHRPLTPPSSGQRSHDALHCGASVLSLPSSQRWNMPILTLEGIVENGQIRLRDPVTLPERTKVYVVIPEVETVPQAHVYSPRLVHPEQAADFAKQVIEVSADAKL